MVRALTDKVDRKQKQDRQGQHRDGKKERKNQKEMLVRKKKNAFHGIISRLDTPEERMPDLEDMSTESLKTKKQKDQGLKINRAEHPGTEG